MYAETVPINQSIHEDEDDSIAARSTETALQDAILTIETLLEAKGYTITSTLDIEGACNNTTRRVIMKEYIRAQPLLTYSSPDRSNVDQKDTNGEEMKVPDSRISQLRVSTRRSTHTFFVNPNS